MLSVALSTLRTRWVAFSGAFVALALGVGIIATIALVMSSAIEGYDRDRTAMTGTVVLLGVSAGVAGFVTIFVVASTFAFAVIQRTRELALLRLVGATPRQVRGMILAEALLLGGAGCVAGCLISLAGAPALAATLVSGGIAPSWFRAGISPGPLLLACLAGLAVAVLGVTAASRRAATVRPTEALRESTGETPGSRRVWSARTWWGLGFLVVALMGMGVIAVALPEISTVPVVYLWVLLMPIAAAALLAPVLTPALLRLLTWPWARGGAIGVLVRENTLTMVRRTAATAVPVLLTVGLSLTLLGALETIGQARVAEAAGQVRAGHVLVPAGGSGIGAAALERARSVPGVEVAALSPVTVRRTDDFGVTEDLFGYATDPGPLAATTDLPLAAGSLRALGRDSIVVNEAWEVDVGRRVEVTPEGGRPVRLTVAAVVEGGVGGADFYLDASRASGVPAELAYVRAPAEAAAALREAMKGTGVTLLTRDEWAATVRDSDQGTSVIGMMVTLGIAVVYSCISIVNTMVMAAAGRRRDLVMLRLAGATRRQAVLSLLAESIVVVAVGMVLAAVAAAVGFAGLLAALTRLLPAASLTIPWAPVVALTAAGALLAIVATTLTAGATLRAPALARAVAAE
ncbi:ABC transporter permease [Nonomuraea sp. FMUSA5-5]|uniref:ABC transporter permease n=1 Tax=Nonomuraea composti TaxID=2720023 RepID=A0ABX1BKR9_9ACTN|nr:ABC transporter permease [Nonomuraea sp. FMUSA5-5]